MTDVALPHDASLGTALRTAREEHGLSVEDVSATTRIRGTVIRDLERDFLTSSGGTVYARGHVKAISAAIGVDPAPYLTLLSRQATDDVPPPPAPALPEPRRAGTEPLRVPTAAPRERRGPNWVAAAAGVLALVVGLYVVGQLVRPSAGPATGSGPAPVASAPSAPAPAVSATSPARKPTAARPAPTGANLRVRLVGGASWVSVRNGTRTLFEGVLPAGTVRDFNDARQLRLVVGNAGAVNLVCSGRDLGPAGGPGAVRRFTCAADGIVPT